MVGVCHKTGEIGHLFVTQSARGSGIGTKLLDVCAQTCGARPALAGRAGCKYGGHRPLPAHGLPAGWRAEHVPAGVDVAFCKPCKELVMRYQPQDQG